MNFLDIYNQFMKNPIAMLSQRFNLPQNVNDPNEILQHLVSSGQVNQQQINNAMQMKNNPMIQQLMGKK